MYRMLREKLSHCTLINESRQIQTGQSFLAVSTSLKSIPMLFLLSDVLFTDLIQSKTKQRFTKHLWVIKQMTGHL